MIHTCTCIYFSPIDLKTIQYKLFEVESFTVVKLNCIILESIWGWIVILYGQSLLDRLFHWKSFTITDRSTKTVKQFHLKQFAMYGMRT